MWHHNKWERVKKEEIGPHARSSVNTQTNTLDTTNCALGHSQWKFHESFMHIKQGAMSPFQMMWHWFNEERDEMSFIQMKPCMHSYQRLMSLKIKQDENL